MKALFSASLLALAILASGCSDAKEAGRATTTVPPGVDDFLNPVETPPGVVLERTGLTAVRSGGTRQPIPFGAPIDDVRANLTPVLGEPHVDEAVEACEGGAASHQLVWPGFLLIFDNGAFAGWEASGDAGLPILAKEGDIGIGSTLAEVTEILGPLELESSARGYEFVASDSQGDTYAGAFESEESSAPLVAFSAGLNCYVR